MNTCHQCRPGATEAATQGMTRRHTPRAVEQRARGDSLRTASTGAHHAPGAESAERWASTRRALTTATLVAASQMALVATMAAFSAHGIESIRDTMTAALPTAVAVVVVLVRHWPRRMLFLSEHEGRTLGLFSMDTQDSQQVGRALLGAFHHVDDST